MALTVEGKIAKALFQKLATLTDCPPIAHPNVKFPAIGADGKQDPFPEGTYLEPSIIWSAPIDTSITGQHRKIGILQVAIMAPIGEGDLKSSELAARIAALFSQNTVIEEDGVKVWITEPPFKNSGFRDKERWRTPVSIRWNSFSP